MRGRVHRDVIQGGSETQGIANARGAEAVTLTPLYCGLPLIAGEWEAVALGTAP
jgi:hypothetical protein